jgi:hypothetical protein
MCSDSCNGSIFLVFYRFNILEEFAGGANSLPFEISKGVRK